MEGRDLLRASGVADEDDQGAPARRDAIRRPGARGGRGAAGRYFGPGRRGRDRGRATDKEYRRLYGREGPDVPLETLTWRLEVASPRPRDPTRTAQRQSRALSEAQKGKREIYLPEHEDFRNVPVYDRYRLDPGAAFEGPAVVEERESTVVLGPDAEVEIDAARNLIVRW